MTIEEMARVMEGMFAEENDARAAGQKEYAHGDAFGNFNRLASQLGLDRKQILWVYFMKHIDGILAYINGHKSQREDVRGRIKDARVYLALLRGMIEEDERVNISSSIGAEISRTATGAPLPSSWVHTGQSTSDCDIPKSPWAGTPPSDLG